MSSFYLKCGFTLMEMLVVMTIVAILMAIAMPSYQNYMRRAHYAEIIQAVSPYQLAVNECYEITGELNACGNGQNGVPELIEFDSTHLINQIRVNQTGVIQVIPNDKDGICSKDDYILTPIIENDTLIWQRSGGGVTAGYAR